MCVSVEEECSVLEKKKERNCVLCALCEKKRIESVPVLIAVGELGICLCRWRIEWCAATETCQSGAGLFEEAKKVRRHQLEKSVPHKE